MSDILIIDDEPGILKLLTVFLEHEGYGATAMDNLMAGLHAATTGNYDVILLDVNMPDGNGLDFLPQFRAVSSAPEILIMTGPGDQDGAGKPKRSSPLMMTSLKISNSLQCSSSQAKTPQRILAWAAF